jgi:hypothetical protein
VDFERQKTRKVRNTHMLVQLANAIPVRIAIMIAHEPTTFDVVFKIPDLEASITFAVRIIINICERIEILPMLRLLYLISILSVDF